MKSHLIKVYHGFARGKKAFRDFLSDMGQTMKGQSAVWGLHQEKGEIFYSISAKDPALQFKSKSGFKGEKLL